MLKKMAILAAVVIAMAVGGTAFADTNTFNLGQINISNVGPGPYATVSIEWVNSTTADVLFTGLQNNGWTYGLGDGSTVALNVNGSFSVSTVTETAWNSTFSALYKQTNIAPPTSEVDGWGRFNLTIDNKDGWPDTAKTVAFTLTATGGNTWDNAADVLTGNDKDFFAAAHIFAQYTGTGNPDGTQELPAGNTGYATTGGKVPEPTSLLLLGLGLIGVGAAARRKIKK